MNMKEELHMMRLGSNSPPPIGTPSQVLRQRSCSFEKLTHEALIRGPCSPRDHLLQLAPSPFTDIKKTSMGTNEATYPRQSLVNQ